VRTRVQVELLDKLLSDAVDFAVAVTGGEDAGLVVGDARVELASALEEVGQGDGLVH
jgi:hypothetical protein